jgi:hypothetical protein
LPRPLLCSIASVVCTISTETSTKGVTERARWRWQLHSSRCRRHLFLSTISTLLPAAGGLQQLTIIGRIGTDIHQEICEMVAGLGCQNVGPALGSSATRKSGGGVIGCDPFDTNDLQWADFRSSSIPGILPPLFPSFCRSKLIEPPNSIHLWSASVAWALPPIPGKDRV